jgi:hypothetical protein
MYNRITGFEDFAHCPEFYQIRKRECFNVSEIEHVSIYRYGKGVTYSVGSL